MFSIIFLKENNFYDFMFAFLEDKVILKLDLLLKERKEFAPLRILSISEELL